jgi:hypothetical protein
MAGPGYWRKDSSTFKRLRKSEHVADLRLIAYVAIVLFITALILCAASIFFPVISGDVCHGSECFGRDFRSIGDIKFSFPIMGVASGVLAWVYRTAAVRLGVVDLFASEIMTLCRVGTAMDIVAISVQRWEARSTARVQPTQTEVAPPNLDRFTSEEQYFPIFSQNSKDLEVLEADVVNEVTAFYTYMKVIRDLRRQLDEARSANDNNEKSEDILLNIIYMLFLGYESARRSIQHLVEYEPAHVENTIVILLTEIVAYTALVTHFASIDTDEDFRYERLKLREVNYETQVEKLKAKIDKYFSVANVRCRNPRRDGDWQQAGKLWPALLRRFADAEISARELEPNTLQGIGPLYAKPPKVATPPAPR